MVTESNIAYAGKSTIYNVFLFFHSELFDLYPLGVYTVYMHNDKQKLIRRLKIIEGQVRGLQNMLQSDIYCIDVITQTSAVKQALSTIEDKLMEGHLGYCLVNQIKKGQADKATKEILKVYQLKRK